MPSTIWKETVAAPWIALAAALAGRLVDPSGDQAMDTRIGTVISDTVLSPPFAWSGPVEVDGLPCGCRSAAAIERWLDPVMACSRLGQIQPNHPPHDGRV